MTIRGCWSRIVLDGEKCLVYGPSLGRLYLLPASQTLDRTLQKLLGLGHFDFQDELGDPAERIIHDRSTLKSQPALKASLFLRAAYRFVHHSRRLVPLRAMVRLAGLLALAAREVGPDTEPEIGRQVHGMEQAVGIADCYPRALMTCYLCLKKGFACKLVVGSLAPTRKMHAWCSVNGLLPYEALPEHYMYRPLLVMTLTP